MDLLSDLVLLPTAGQWPLLEPLIFLMLIFFLPFAGLLLFTSTFAIIIQDRSESLARNLIAFGMGNMKIWVALGILPLIALIFLFSQYLFDAQLPVGGYLTKISLLALFSFGFLAFYKTTLKRPAGALGAFLLLGVLFHFSSVITLIAVPEQWQFVQLPVPFITSVQTVVHFLVIMSSALLFAGAWIIFMGFNWPDTKLQLDEKEIVLLKGFGWGALLAGGFVLPPLLLWDMWTTPIYAVTSRVFSPLYLIIFLLLISVLKTVSMIHRDSVRNGWLVLVVSLCVMGLYTAKQLVAISTSNREYELQMTALIAEAREELVAQREDLYTSAAVIDPEAGERIFNQICSACHSFESRVIGPPYNEVLPKYIDDPEGLTSFIWKPVKVDPDYPSMPGQGLKKSDARSVAYYLISRFTGEIPERPTGGGEE